MSINKTAHLIFLLIIIPVFNYAQDDNSNDRHKFTMISQIETTPVKSQDRTGTCWSFATTSFIETELIRKGNEPLDISEMYFVRYKLLSMAEKYIRHHGRYNFGSGGQAHDVFDVVKKHGFIPEEFYSGKNIGKDYHDQGEMMAVLNGLLEGILKRDSRTLTPKWKEAFEKVVDTYLGDLPEKFDFNDEQISPAEFAERLDFNPDDYVELTSYTHFPFYTKMILDVPDNWSNGYYYNLPIDEFIEVINYALQNDFSVAWDGDCGRDNFYRDEGYAVIPDDEKTEDDESGPEVEKVITQKMRQNVYDNFDVTDDHLMHLVGLAEDQNGTKFYYTKNSWGTKKKKYDGFWLMSEPYVRLKTIAIAVHKDALPKEIKEKLKIQ